MSIKVAVHAFAFGGSGSKPGEANEAIAAVAAERGRDKLVFAEPELGPVLRRLYPDRPVFEVPEPPKRRDYLPLVTLQRFEEWLQMPGHGSKAIVLLGAANTSDELPSARRVGWMRQLLHRPAVQQVALFLGLPLDHAPKYRSCDWIVRQMAQLGLVAGVDGVELVGQRLHLRDYAARWAELEYQRFGITVTGSTHTEEDDRLTVWDEHSNQEWVHGPDQWNGARLRGTQVASFVLPRLHRLVAKEPPGLTQ